MVMNLLLPEVKSAANAQYKAGLWRAWIRHHTLGQRGVCDFKALAADMRAAKQRQDPLLVLLGQIGKAGKAASKKVGQRSSLGLRTKERQRMRLVQQRTSLSLRSQGLTTLQKALALSQDVHTSGIAGIMKSAKRMQKLDGLAKKEGKEQQLNILKQYGDVVGKPLVETLKRVLPNLPVEPEHIHPVPARTCTAFWLPCLGSEAASAATAYASASSKTNLGTALDKEWSERHEAVTSKIAPDEQQYPQQKCRDAGLCLCSVEGKSICKLRETTLAIIKNQLKNPLKKEQFKKAEIVLQFAREECCELHVLDQDPGHEWVHVGNLKLSPYQLVYLKLLPVSVLDAKDEASGRITLEVFFLVLYLVLSLAASKCETMGLPLVQSKASSTFYTEYEFCSTLCKQCKWSLQFHALEKTRRPLTQLQPGHVSVVPLPEYGKHHLWPVQRAKRARRVHRHERAALGILAGGADEPATDDEADVNADEGIVVEDGLDSGLEGDHICTGQLKPQDMKSEVYKDISLEIKQFPFKVFWGVALDVVAIQPAAHNPASARVIVRENAPVPAAAVCHVEGGYIAYHRSKEAFECHCNIIAHGRCLISRTALGRASRRDGERQGGRPLGLMLCWLKDGKKHSSRDLHREKGLWQWTQQERLAARAVLKESEEGRKLLGFERPCRLDEPEEAETLEGMRITSDAMHVLLVDHVLSENSTSEVTLQQVAATFKSQASFLGGGGRALMWKTEFPENPHEGAIRKQIGCWKVHTLFLSGRISTCQRPPRKAQNLLYRVSTCCLVLSGLHDLCHPVVGAQG
eukprot:5131593-Amphidinium_carterae.3